ncbi:hypothetical protein ACFLQV_00700 [Calditrichota bacterium]
MNITNWGFFGNYSIWGGVADVMDDPEFPGQWAPQCEFPAGSGVQYLFQGSLWLGAMVQEEGYEFPRVSTGTDGWVRPRVNEFYPPEGDAGAIIERSTRPNSFNRLGEYVTHPDAISEQDFLAVYSDTLTDPFYIEDDPIDGPHFPLGIKITQKSYAWSYNYAQNFIIIDWEIENIAGNYLKNLYVGLYVDADVGWTGEQNDWYLDDICGFQRYFYYERPDGMLDSTVINTAYIADNDGRPVTTASGNQFTAPGVTGVRVVRAPNPQLRTSFNWWVSRGDDPGLDFGPAWSDDGAPAGWTDTYGTPMGDTRKYFVLSNGEFDYDQVFVDDPEFIQSNPQEIRDRWDQDLILESHNWKVPGTEGTPENLITNLANGFDTRYLLSWGPLGIFDHIDQAGNRVYRLNPGEKFSMTVAYVAGSDFHDRNDPQANNENIDETKFNFNSLRYNADWAARVYDNPMIDTPVFDFGEDHNQNIFDNNRTQGDGILETGDGWYGEDTGNDGLFAVVPGDPAYRWEGGDRVRYVYPGPDADGSENDGHLTQIEDSQERPEEFDYTRLNGILDFGDGVPDFLGPPSPPVPSLEILKTPVTVRRGDEVLNIREQELKDWVVLKWNKYPSEAPDYTDPFSREWDFEGYRVYSSNTGLEQEFSFMDGFDIEDFAYFSVTDSLISKPILLTPPTSPDTTINGVTYYARAVGENTGLIGEGDFWADTTTGDYFYVIQDAHPLMPRYYAVTAYDYGDYKTGTPSLESAKRANMIYVAPDGLDKDPVMVVPNPYRANADYTQEHGDGFSWENRDDGTADFFPQTDRRLYFFNLPMYCLIRIYTVSGDLVDMIPHNIEGDDNFGWFSDYAEAWDLNSRNHQQVVAGLYIFTIEEYDGEDGKGSTDYQTGKFVVIR